MDAKVTAIILVLFVLHLSSIKGTVNGQEPVDLRCRCIKYTSGFRVRSRIKEIEIIPSGPYCPKVEVIAMLKSNQKVCLNPEVYWVTSKSASSWHRSANLPRLPPTQGLEVHSLRL
ncbi:interleukin-8-like [Pristis pectinata]|uniref:interleukin-8-like n=1 Tax=Pristis pectinata TaxID=685728 RepID=UPI00223E582B|nr:interleukin-8-like [Pristis pectinata]